MFSTALLLVALAVPPDTVPRDTILPAPILILDSPQALSLAPTLDNLSLLGAALAREPAPVPAPGADLVPEPQDTTRPRRPRAVEYSDLYYTRLRIHQLASYLTVPLFAAQYLSGRALWKNPDSDGLARDAHGPLAAAVAGLFAVNTVTGVWNLWESRKDPNGRTRRWVHGLLMIAADAGFVAVGATAPDDDFRENGGSGGSSGASTHRDLAIGSMAVALSSYLMMLVWK
jgi:hypothetical protein